MKVNEIENEIKDENLEVKKEIAKRRLKKLNEERQYLYDKVSIHYDLLEDSKKKLKAKECELSVFKETDVEDIEIPETESGSGPDFYSFLDDLEKQISKGFNNFDGIKW